MRELNVGIHLTALFVPARVRPVYQEYLVTVSHLTARFYLSPLPAYGNVPLFYLASAERAEIPVRTPWLAALRPAAGKLLPGTDPDSLKAYGSAIEEGRADLFGLYYVADPKLVELGLTPNADAYKSQYYTYMQNGLLTQLVRIKPGQNIEEAHMRNRAFIAHWVLEHGKADKVVELVKIKGKTYVRINDYEALRGLFGELLAEVQRIKSEGDYEAARKLVETYGVKVDPAIHREVLERYERLHLSPYKGFINPVYTALRDSNGNIIDVRISYTEGYAEQMLRYSREYNNLPDVN